jgi:hypothetical protein
MTAITAITHVAVTATATLNHSLHHNSDPIDPASFSGNDPTLSF